MFRFIKAIFFTTVMFLSCNALKCVSVNNQKCKIRPELIKINSNDLSFYPYNILAVPVAKILIIHKLNYAFLMLVKT